ncbi:MAG: efflux RND transporter permease subunit, partial [Bdellovibrionaceae bacterium]|nr:efflux RND transporter permease subunit [Pseudobdellovibrionaceae bacterium]
TLTSLTLFKSNLSLNSALGVILLNGISVANSIILVDFIKELKSRGLSPRKAAVEASKARLRPILMTSLTTVLGMLPIALGFGSGGKILQPLGISVAGGLWVSMLFTLYFVPTLQTYYFEWKKNDEIQKEKC